MTITQDNYLDLGNLLIYELVGSVGLFLLLGWIFITYYGVSRRVPLNAIIGMNMLFTFMVLSYQYNVLWLMLILLILGGIIYLLYARVFKR